VTSTWPDLPNEDGLGFAFDRQALAARQSIAAELTGHTVAEVTYVLLEYEYDKYGDHTGFRTVTDPAELEKPSWKYDGFHNADYGIHFVLDNGAQYFVTWDNPGWIESLRLAKGPFPEWTGTLCNVSDVSPWAQLAITPIDRFDLNYEPWSDEGGFWCRSMTILAGKLTITIHGADANGDGTMSPSADNVAVTFLVAD
jgi:hypothetical protein